MIDLSVKTREDHALCEHITDLEAQMQNRTLDWARINTGSWNTEGLLELAPKLGDAFSMLDAETVLTPTKPFEVVNSSGSVDEFQTGPIVSVTARPEAPVQIIMSGH